jgi:diguanylate cyclase (GGDEF)-like protein
MILSWRGSYAGYEGASFPLGPSFHLGPDDAPVKRWAPQSATLGETPARKAIWHKSEENPQATPRRDGHFSSAFASSGAFHRYGDRLNTQAEEETHAERGAAAASLGERLDIVTRMARRLFRVPIVLLSLVDEGELRLASCQGVPSSALGSEIAFDRATFTNDGPLLVTRLTEDERFREHPWVIGGPRVQYYAGTLVLGPDDEIGGVLSVCDRSPDALAEGDLMLLRDLARLVESELRLAALGRAQAAFDDERAALRRRALIDTRTQLWNRHAMFELLDREFHRARRVQEEVAVVLAEIDDFPAIAQAHGSTAADQVLKEVTSRIRTLVRRSDTVSRFGPDEFLVFLGRCDLESAATLAERMRHRIRKSVVDVGTAQLRLTMTFGVAASDERSDWTPDSLVRRADEALAEAVRSGRDRVVALKL